jgi:hypothetical protein
MLVLNGTPLPDDYTVDGIMNQTMIAAANRAFLQQDQSELGAEHRSICVLQAEQAITSYGDQEIYIGSEDATTCLIAVVLCQATKKAWVAHFDDSTSEDVEAVTTALDTFQAPQLYLTGAYDEPSGCSLRACRAILNLFHASPQPIDLRLACIFTANTSATKSPCTRSLVVNCKTGAAHPFTFADRGPEVPRRFATRYCLPSSKQLMHVMQGDEMVLRPLPTRMPPPYLRYFQLLLSLDDHTLLREQSTSPEHEGPKFVSGRGYRSRAGDACI